MADAGSQDRSEVYAIYIISSLALVGIIVLYSGYRKQNKLRKLGHKWTKWMPEIMKAPAGKWAGQNGLNAAIVAGVAESASITRTMQQRHAEHWAHLRQRRASNNVSSPVEPPTRVSKTSTDTVFIRESVHEEDEYSDTSKSHSSPSATFHNPINAPESSPSSGSDDHLRQDASGLEDRVLESMVSPQQPGVQHSSVDGAESVSGGATTVETTV
eukprot:m.57657 g.57657  ORF g.57657 m.57657 type:complete len:214 (+) comp17122_c0_seq1:73-714(+)